MKNWLPLLLCFILTASVSAQFNVTLKSQVDYDQILNDIWGWAAPDGREYAIVGLTESVSIVDVTDPENPVIKGTIPGPESIWRDMKTYAGYAYVTNDDEGGLLVVDLNNLPNPITEDDYYYWEPNFPDGQLERCHNIYIDENGYAYLAGCNLNEGGIIYLDVFSNPGQPSLVDYGFPVYSHDVYVRDNKTYCSEIYEGVFTVYDVTDKNNTTFLGAHPTPFNFTHNAWLSDDSNYLFTTDERANAPVASYDVSDLNNIQEVDQFKPLETLGDGVIPHNVHVFQNWLIISYYTDGCIIVDATNPHNLIEVGNFDTYIGGADGFEGAWGAYPFLPSGNILVSDRGNGLYVLAPNYVQACFLEGLVTDIDSDLPIQGVEVSINSSELNEGSTNFFGNYATGVATAGTFTVDFSHPAYLDASASVTLVNGEITILDIQMTKLPHQPFSGQVLEEGTGIPIAGATISLDGPILDYEATSDANGNFTINEALEESYDILVGHWGHNTHSETYNLEGAPGQLVVELAKGYKDDFILDLGWIINSTAPRGAWVRADPIGTSFQGSAVNPNEDVLDDLGDLCYVTGNGEGAFNAFDVDDGYTRLISPMMDLTELNEPVIKYDYWLNSITFNSDFDDPMIISVNNGIETVVVQEVTTPSASWRESEINLNDFLTPTETVQITFEVSDNFIGSNNLGHVTEGGVDAFLVYDANPTSVEDLSLAVETFEVFPNPFKESFSVSFELTEAPINGSLRVFNMLGKMVEDIAIVDQIGMLEIENIDQAGIYFIQIVSDNKLSESLKVVKID